MLSLVVAAAVLLAWPATISTVNYKPGAKVCSQTGIEELPSCVSSITKKPQFFGLPALLIYSRNSYSRTLNSYSPTFHNGHIDSYIDNGSDTISFNLWPSVISSLLVGLLVYLLWPKLRITRS
jgi:hypothetical protein